MMKNSIADRRFSSTKTIWLYVMTAAYVLAGVNHFLNHGMYLRIIPGFIPFHEAVNYAAGCAEILLGVLLLSPRTRNVAARGIILLLIAVFPANVKMAYDYTVHDHPFAWVAWLRLPLQGLLVWWAYIYTNVRKRKTGTQQSLKD